MSIPVLIIAYSRTANVLKQIEDLRSQGVQKIYLSIDGSKTGNDELQAQIEVNAKSIASDIGVELLVWRRNQNFGPAVSVLTAIDWFFRNEEYGLILEDDLLLSSDAVGFFDLALSTFFSDRDVFLISGSNYFDDELTTSNGFFATSYPVIWGWATWRDRWDHFRAQISNLENVRLSLGLNERWYWKTGLRRCLSGIKDAWDIPLVTFQYANQFLSILPPVNLISNCGVDDYAGNTFIDEWPLNCPLKTLPTIAFSRSMVQFVETNKADINYLDSLFRSKVYKIGSYGALPPVLSKIVDLIRFPIHGRKAPLRNRLAEVVYP